MRLEKIGEGAEERGTVESEDHRSRGGGGSGGGGSCFSVYFALFAESLVKMTAPAATKGKLTLEK